MRSLLSDLWSFVVPTALSLCGLLMLLAVLAEIVAKRRASKSQASSLAPLAPLAPLAASAGASSPSLSEPSVAMPAIATPSPFAFSFAFSFALPFAPVLLLLALWLSPQTAATTVTLLVRQSPDALPLLLLFAPLALFFLWGEGSAVARAQRTEREVRGSAIGDKDTLYAPKTPLEQIALRIFAAPPFSALAYKTARVSAVVFALFCLLSLLCDLVPTLAHLFFHHAARASLHSPLQITESSIVSLVGLGLLLVLALPQVFPQPSKATAWLLLLLLPCALLFYGVLCLVATREATSIVELEAMSLATRSALDADTRLATLGIFRPAFGWLALLCCIPLAKRRDNARATNTTVARVATALFLCFIFACLLGFVVATAAPVVATQTWLLGEEGLKPLHAAFLSLYPEEGWLLDASLAALSATTLLALVVLTQAALTVIHEKAMLFTLLLVLPVATLAMLANGNEGWQTSLLFALQRAQQLGQLAQGVATLLFVVALGALSLRVLTRLWTQENPR